MFVGAIGDHHRGSNNPEAWEPPPANMFKLDFDGASKGNPGPTSFGGDIRNSTGCVIGLYWGYIGENTNNVEELKGLIVGLVMVITYGWFSIILEGDSQIILQMTSNLLHGKLVNKVAENWRIAHNLEQLREFLHGHSEVHIHHVKKKG